MPLCLEPGATFDYVLKSDERKPEPKPSFRFRFVSVRDVVESSERLRKIEAGNPTSAQTAANLIEEIKTNLVGWNLTDAQGAAITYDPDRLDYVLTLHELWELYYASQSGKKLAGSEKNASGSQSPTSTGVSVARANRAAAKTP